MFFLFVFHVCMPLFVLIYLCSIPFVFGKGIGPSLPSAPLQADLSQSRTSRTRAIAQPGKADAIAQRDAIAHFENLRNRATW